MRPSWFKEHGEPTEPGDILRWNVQNRRWPWGVEQVLSSQKMECSIKWDTYFMEWGGRSINGKRKKDSNPNQKPMRKVKKIAFNHFLNPSKWNYITVFFPSLILNIPSKICVCVFTWFVPCRKEKCVACLIFWRDFDMKSSGFVFLDFNNVADSESSLIPFHWTGSKVRVNFMGSRLVMFF